MANVPASVCTDRISSMPASWSDPDASPATNDSNPERCWRTSPTIIWSRAGSTVGSDGASSVVVVFSPDSSATISTGISGSGVTASPAEPAVVEGISSTSARRLSGIRPSSVLTCSSLPLVNCRAKPDRLPMPSALNSLCSPRSLVFSSSSAPMARLTAWPTDVL